MLDMSGLLTQLGGLFPEGMQIYSLYGDPAYPQSRWIFGYFPNAQNGSPGATWNKEMSKVGETVEWRFGKIVDLWRYLD